VSSPIELTLPEEAPGTVELPSEAGDLVVSVPDVVEDPGPEPELDGSTAVVADDQTDLEIKIDAHPWGIQHSLIVDDPQGPSSYELDIELPVGVTAEDSSRGVDFLDEQDNLIGFFGEGIAEDAAGADASVHVDVVAQASGVATIEIAADPTWFADPARSFPITIDPGIDVSPDTASDGADVFVQSNLTSSHWTLPRLKIGEKPSAGTQTARSFLRFDLPVGLLPLPGVVVTDANLAIDLEEPGTCNASSIRLYELDQPFGASTVWSNQPSVGWGPITPSGSCTPSTSIANLDVTSLVQRTYEGTDPNNYGYAMRATTESSTSQWKVFASGESASPDVPPTLTVNYNVQFPSAPPLVSPADGATVASLTPTLAADAVADADGDEVRYWFRAWTGDTTTPSGQILDSGWILPPSGQDPTWTLPAGELVDGTTYRWRVSATDFGDGEPIHSPSNSGGRIVHVNQRLGTNGPSAYESIGPVTVNMATGNATTTIAGPNLRSVAGDVGVALSYNSMDQQLTGLTGKYINDWNGNHEIDSGSEHVVVSRTDPAVSFNWGAESPQPGVGEDSFIVRWRGTITVPSTGYYSFGGNHDGGMRIALGSSYIGSPNPSSSYNALDEWTGASAAGAPDWGAPQHLTANRPARSFMVGARLVGTR
jgi:hypothetical protein